MSTDRWQRLQDLFHGAVVLPPAEREGFLAAACADDPELRRQIDRLLAAHDRPEGIIEKAIGSDELWPEEDEASAVGRRFGAYRAVRELGRGGMGSVYLGERADGQFEQLVAIKAIKRGMDTAQLLQRFRAERQILASLDHPNIARLLDGGTAIDGQPYFVMEYIDGQPIDVYADAHALTVRERLELFLHVASAVMYAHQHLIVHRDIKPLNILVTSEGVPNLLDFGIAKMLQADADEATSTLTGVRMLTPDYASPEQVEGRHATTVSDVYSLGVVLYELLTGRSPYRLKSRGPLEVAEAVRTTEPARPSNVVSADTQTQSGRQRSGVAQDRALELHQQNLANDSAATFGQFRAGEALVQLGRYAEALPHLRRAMELGNQDFVTDSLSLFQRLSRAMIQSGMCKALAKLTRPDAATACARTARFVDATPVEPTHAFPRAHFAGLWLEIGEAYEALAQQARLAEAERDAHHLAARDSYRKSLDIWQDLTTRKLISPIDTTRFRVAALAVERTNGALGKP